MQYYRVYDRDGNFKRIIEKEKESQLGDDEWLKGVTCFVINEKGEVLIEKRVDKGITPGQLDLCSGHVDGNEIPTQAMIRELKEELGIENQEGMNVIKLTQEELPLEFEGLGRTLNFFITPYCLKRNSSEVTIQEKEIEYISWVPQEKCFELIKANKMKFPSNYDYGDIFQKVRNICDGKKINDNLER